MTERIKISVAVSLALVLAVAISGCAQFGGGVSASTTPLEGREYVVLGHEVGKDTMPLIFGFYPGGGIPLSGQCTVEEAIQDVLEEYRGADAMINVTVDVYWHTWILFQVFTTRVEGDVIRFTN